MTFLATCSSSDFSSHYNSVLTFFFHLYLFLFCGGKFWTTEILVLWQLYWQGIMDNGDFCDETVNNVLWCKSFWPCLTRYRLFSVSSTIIDCYWITFGLIIDQYRLLFHMSVIVMWIMLNPPWWMTPVGLIFTLFTEESHLSSGGRSVSISLCKLL